MNYGHRFQSSETEYAAIVPHVQADTFISIVKGIVDHSGVDNAKQQRRKDTISGLDDAIQCPQ